jgi:hypothetical protein
VSKANPSRCCLEAAMNRTRTITLNIDLVEKEAETTADVSFTTGDGTVLTSHGIARRNPRDPDVPEIGDEIAVARALSEMAHKLLDVAAGEISKAEHRRVRLTS